MDKFSPEEQEKFAKWIEKRGEIIYEGIHQEGGIKGSSRFRLREAIVLAESAEMIRQGLNPDGTKQE